MLCAVVSTFMTTLSAIAVILNLLLLPLITFKDIGSYKVLLFLYTSIAIVYATVTWIMVPIFEPSDKGWLFYAMVQRVPQFLGSCLILLFSFCYINLLLIITYSFLYRYFVMCAPEKLSWFHRIDKLIVLVVVYAAVVFLCIGYSIPYMLMNKDLATALENDKSFNIDLKTTSFVGAPFFRNGHLVSECIMIVVIWTIVIVSSTSICAFCVIKIIVAFRTTTAAMTASEKFRKLQTVVPLIFTFLPVLISYVLAAASLHAAGISQISSGLMPVAQVLDPILIFGLVTEYRMALINAIKKHIAEFKVYSSRVTGVTNFQHFATTPTD